MRDQGLRMYRALLGLFPPRYRKEHGRALERLFQDTHAAWGRERGGHGAAFWLRIAGDVVRGAAAEVMAAGVALAFGLLTIGSFLRVPGPADAT